MSRPCGSTHRLTHDPSLPFGTECNSSALNPLATFSDSAGVAGGSPSLPPAAAASVAPVSRAHGRSPRLPTTVAAAQVLSSKSSPCQPGASVADARQDSSVATAVGSPSADSTTSRTSIPALPRELYPLAARTCRPPLIRGFDSPPRSAVTSLNAGLDQSLLSATSLPSR